MMLQVSDILRRWDEAVVVPMVQEAQLEPIRKRDDFTFGPGTIAAFVNGSDSFDYLADSNVVQWTPLAIQYTDRHGNLGNVYQLEASMNCGTEQVTLTKAEISGILSLVRGTDSVDWMNPLTGRLYRQIHIGHGAVDFANNILLNSWQIFRGGILPMLLNESYWFMPEENQQGFQVAILHHLRRLYEGLLP